MANKIPLKVIITEGDTSALSEFNPGDTVGIEFGGTGAATLTEAKDNLGISAIESELADKADQEDFSSHINNTNNPHLVTKAQVGLGNVDNTEDIAKPISSATQTALNEKAPINNPTFTGTVAGITKAMVGLGNVDNTSDENKPISTATQSALNLKADLVSGIVPSSQLPSYVDDVLEYANLAAFPVTGESGKIYVALATNKTYRWSGSAYTEISASPGSTDSVVEGSNNLYFTVARVRAVVLTGLSLATGTVIAATDTILAALGKLQKQISDNLTTLTSHTSNTSNPHAVTKTQVGLGNVDNTSDANKPVSTATQTALDLKVSKTDAFYVEASSSMETIIPPDLSRAYFSGWVKSSDFNNVFNTSTGKYQPTQAGWYLITSTVNFDNSIQTASVLRGEIVLVDTSVSYASSAVKDGYPVVFVSAIVYLNGTTDYIRIAARQFSTGTISGIYGTLRAILLKAL